MNVQLLWSVMAIGMVVGVNLPDGQSASARAQIVFPDKTTVSAEIADTEAKRQQGLMHREKMADNEGMLFIFDVPGEHPFWMKNTLIPLDMLWLDRDLNILHIAHSVPPCKADPCPTYPPAAGTRASFVLELVSGFAKAHKLQPDQKLVASGLPLPR